MQRIEAFLREDEVPEWASTLSADMFGDSSNDKIEFSTASFEWQEKKDPEATPSRFQLGPLDIAFPRGQLTLISGATGSGKTAMLAALLGGELYLTKPTRSREI